MAVVDRTIRMLTMSVVDGYKSAAGSSPMATRRALDKALTKSYETKQLRKKMNTRKRNFAITNIL